MGIASLHPSYEVVSDYEMGIASLHPSYGIMDGVAGNGPMGIASLHPSYCVILWDFT